ncbi:MAG TPA: hypothetical protein VGX94_12660 [Terriglobia bacterium]|nr:hypothetical protein [Terriglobia bacterium]
MNCWVCEKARPDYPIPADFLIDERPVCRFHTNDLSPRAPLPKEATPVAAQPVITQLPQPERPYRKILDLEPLIAARAAGLSYRAIAQRFGVSYETARRHLIRTERAAFAERETERAQAVGELDERAKFHASLPLAAENHEGGNATMLFEKKELDLEALKADRAGDLTVAQLAEKYECGITTIRTRLNGAKPASAKRKPAVARANGHATTPTNGHAVTTDADELDRLLDGWWQKLPVLERVRLLLARVPQ